MSAGPRRWLSIAAVCVVLPASGSLVGCSKDSSDTAGQGASQQNSQSQQTSEKPKTPTSGTAGKLPTLAEYIQQNNITETEVMPNDPNAPEVKLPALPGWQPAGAATPKGAYGALIGVDPALGDQKPSITVTYSKLGGDPDPAELLKLAPNEVRNLPGFDGSDAVPGKISGYDSTSIIGSFDRNGDGNKRVAFQETVAIPSKDGLYVMQINADGVMAQVPVLMQVFDAINAKGTIKQPAER